MDKPPPNPNDTGWCPLIAAVDRRAQQTGLELAILDVQQAGANSELDIMRRNRVSGVCEWVAASDWKPHAINLNLSLDDVPLYVSIIYHHPDIGEWVYFCWQPDFDRLYFSSVSADQDDARGQPSPSTQEPTPQHRKPRKKGGGRRPTYTAEQQQWLREHYSSDLKAEPLLAKHDAAVAHVQNLAKIKYGIVAGRDTLLDQIIRPALRTYSSMEK